MPMSEQKPLPRHHHHLLRAANRISGAVMWANLVFLFWLSLIPVLTEWLREEYRSALPAATYGCVALTAGVALFFPSRTPIRADGRDPAGARAPRSDIKRTPCPAEYAPPVVREFVRPRPACTR